MLLRSRERGAEARAELRAALERKEVRGSYSHALSHVPHFLIATTGSLLPV